MGRTGTLTPVARFEPVDMDGSTVERASLHNLSVMNELLGKPWVGQRIEVFKSNMIIPQVFSADKSCTYVFKNGESITSPVFLETPFTCPVCGGSTAKRTTEGSIFLDCTNPACEGKLINIIEHFASKKGLDIKGISKATIEKLIDWEWVKSCSDLFTLLSYRSEWVKKPGFGPKSVDKILDAIETSSLNCDLAQFIAALGIPLIGTSAAKELVKTFKTWDAFYSAVKNNYSFYTLPNFGYEMNSSLLSFNYDEASYIADNFIKFNSNEQAEVSQSTLEGLTFVVTGKLVNFKNRDEITSRIESLGGKVSGSVSKNTSYLINNDTESTSSKNKTAKSLGIPILSESDFIQMLESCT
jgi:DNA ligase (NAD+)